jgi:Uncharacterized protein conserved in bacteria (DUF2213)
MPTQDCSFQGRKGKKYGPSGKCYHGVGAAKKADAQGKAMEASKHEDEDQSGFHEDAELLDKIKANGMTLHTNDVKITGKPIFKNELITVVPILLTEEGVHNNALKDWDTLYDPNGLEGFMWFERRPIVDGHPGHAVNHLTKKYGYIQNVEPDPATRTVPAEAVLFNSMFSDAQMQEIDSGTWKGISIGYYCNELKMNGLQTWTDGSTYDHKEIGPLYADHVALTNRPACKRCGINTNSSDDLCSNCSTIKSIEDDIIMEITPPASAGKEGAPAGVVETPEKLAMNELGKKAILAIDKKLKANQIPEEIAIKARTILGLSGDEYARGRAALDLLMEIALEEEEEEGPAGEGMVGNALKGDCPHAKKPADADKTDPNAKENDSVMKELTPLVNSITELTTVVKALKTDSDTTKEELKQLKEKDTARENEIKTNAEKVLSESLKKNFDPAYQMDWEVKHWPAIKGNSLGITGFLADKENLKHWDPKANEAVEQDPVGMNFAMHTDSSVPKGLKMMSIEEMTRKQYPNAAKAQEAGKA